jgi:hypothetical protein
MNQLADIYERTRKCEFIFDLMAKYGYHHVNVLDQHLDLVIEVLKRESYTQPQIDEFVKLIST